MYLPSQMGMVLHPKDYCFGKMGLGVVQDLSKCQQQWKLEEHSTLTDSGMVSYVVPYCSVLMWCERCLLASAAGLGRLSSPCLASMPRLHHAPGSPGVRAHPGNPSDKIKWAPTMTESESADKTIKAGILSPFL